MNGLLVIIPCGQGKVWDSAPHHGPALARDAYTGAPFKVNRAYAEHFAERWVILSAKYGFILPVFVIPEPYNVTFKRPATGPVGVARLRQQIGELGLERYPLVAGLGGKEYRAMIVQAFAGRPAVLRFPFAGLAIGTGMQAIKRAVALGEPFPQR
jgi:hypothetical protein